MKIIECFLFFPCFFLISCGTPETIIVPEKPTGETRAVDPIEQFLEISCDPSRTDAILREIRELPENSIATNVSLREDCRGNRIPKIVHAALSQKTLYLVRLFPQFANDGSSDPSQYAFTDDEIRLMAKAPWKWFSADGLSAAQYKILRNEKTPEREGFEPEWGPDYYTKEERNACDAALDGYSGSDEAQMQKLSRERVQCYKNLPPLP